MIEWGRLITAMVTPFDENLEVDYRKAVELAKILVEEGTTALVVAGTTGESPTLTIEEEAILFKTLKKEIDVPIIAGVGTNSTKQTIEMGLIARDCGVDGIMVVVPYYNKPNQACLKKHFAAVAERVDLPIMLYNVPGRTGTNMEADTVIALSQFKNIVALKDASGNLVQICEIIKRTPDDFLVYSGDDALTIPVLAVGGYGVVSVASHVVGKQMTHMIDCFLKGELAKSVELNLKLQPIFNDLFITANPIPVKAALKLRNIDVGKLRLPLDEATNEVKEILRKDLQELGIIQRN